MMTMMKCVRVTAGAYSGLMALVLALCLATGSPAQTVQPPVQDAVLQAQVDLFADAASQIAAARNTLNDLAGKVDSSADDDARLVDIWVKVDGVGKAAINASVIVRPRFNEIKARLAEMGAAPADGTAEDPALAQERAKLNAERNDINKLTADAENLSIAATKLGNHITSLRRDLFAAAIFKRTAMSYGVILDAKQASQIELADFTRAVGSWMTFVWKFKSGSLISALFLSILAAFILISGGYRLFSPFIRRDVQEEKPSYISRLSVAFWSTTIPSLAIAGFAVIIYFLLRNFNVLRPDIDVMVSSLLSTIVGICFVWMLTHAVLAPNSAHWRLVNISNGGAKLILRSIVALAVVNGLDYLLTGISGALNSPLVLTVAKSFFASTIAGFILFSMAFIRPVIADGENPDQKGRPWPRVISVTVALAGLWLIGASLFGYVGLARFISTQIVVTGAILVTMYIGLLSGKAVSRQEALADTVVGRFLAGTFQLNAVNIDQAGLVAGLLIYAGVLVIGVPLIMLQWGFRIEDIEFWFYRVFTDIQIGNINISLIGILAGIIVFVLGLFATRWFQRWLDGSVMARSKVDVGVRNSVKTGLGYLGIALAALVGISAAGIDLSSIALVAGALSLGIGFGLQNIVSNFVSGLILLAERPFKVGDFVVTGTTEGIVKRISVRATEIETFQHQSIIVPNSELINASVGNWTHRNNMGRTEIPIGVSYDCDPRKVMDILLDIAVNHPKVLSEPEPMVVFVGFGDFSLDFELRVHLADLMGGVGVRNDLRLAIFERFKAENIEIPLPQRNLNITMNNETAEGPEPSAKDEISRLAAQQIRIAAERSKRAGKTEKTTKFTEENPES
jgi:potassium-dependent mechanosensitive channel